MPNKRYDEDLDDDNAGLPQKVKGPKGGPAVFKEYSDPKGGVEEQKADLNKTGVAMPQDSEKHLPKAGGAI